MMKRVRKTFWYLLEVGEVFHLAGRYKKWWLIPMLVILLIFLVLFTAVEGTIVAPFVYTLF